MVHLAQFLDFRVHRVLVFFERHDTLAG